MVMCCEEVFTEQKMRGTETAGSQRNTAEAIDFPRDAG